MLVAIGAGADAVCGNVHARCAPFFMSWILSTPASIASTVQRRAAAWKANRQRGVQNRCT
jgi:hypothetical protein